jgi:cbb3-type cytochrome oxidase cytochrome c subunit
MTGRRIPHYPRWRQHHCSPHTVVPKSVHPNTFLSYDPRELQKMLNKLQAIEIFAETGHGKTSRSCAGVLRDMARMKLPSKAEKMIDPEGRFIKYGVRKATRHRQGALYELVQAITQYRKLSESKPLTLTRGTTPTRSGS